MMLEKNRLVLFRAVQAFLDEAFLDETAELKSLPSIANINGRNAMTFKSLLGALCAVFIAAACVATPQRAIASSSPKR